MCETGMGKLQLGLLVALAVGLGGCGKGPTVVHGKPVRHWVESLDSPDARLRKQAVEALGNVGSADPEVVPALVRAVKDKDTRVRAAAVLALLKIGPDALDAIPALQAAQQDKNAQVRIYATKALARIRPER
jgi:HEAT repeat protein